MRRKLYLSLIPLGAIALLGILVFLITPAVAQETEAGALEVVASGLDNPRGLSFSPTGDIYVAEAGRGGNEDPCLTPGPNGWKQCFGPTGAVTRVQEGEQERIVTGLPSHASKDEDGPYQDGWFADGPADISFLGQGNSYIVVGGGPTPAFEQLVRVLPNGQLQNIADLEAYEELNNPDDGELGSNPYAVLALPSKRIVIDAAANDLLQVGAAGGISTLAAFPVRNGPDGDFESVPTTVTLGPDGAFYVGELTGYPFPVGEAQIYRIPRDHDPAVLPPVYLGGFTQIIDLAFDEDGNLYVLEISTASLADVTQKDFNLSTGALIRADPGGSRETLVSGLTMPAGIALDPDNGSIYITNCGVCVGEGEVIRLDLD